MDTDDANACCRCLRPPAYSSTRLSSSARNKQRVQSGAGRPALASTQRAAASVPPRETAPAKRPPAELVADTERLGGAGGGGAGLRGWQGQVPGGGDEAGGDAGGGGRGGGGGGVAAAGLPRRLHGHRLVGRGGPRPDAHRPAAPQHTLPRHGSLPSYRPAPRPRPPARPPSLPPTLPPRLPAPRAHPPLALHPSNHPPKNSVVGAAAAAGLLRWESGGCRRDESCYGVRVLCGGADGGRAFVCCWSGRGD